MKLKVLCVMITVIQKINLNYHVLSSYSAGIVYDHIFREIKKGKTKHSLFLLKNNTSPLVLMHYKHYPFICGR